MGHSHPGSLGVIFLDRMGLRPDPKRRKPEIFV